MCFFSQKLPFKIRVFGFNRKNNLRESLLYKRLCPHSLHKKLWLTEMSIFLIPFFGLYGLFKKNWESLSIFFFMKLDQNDFCSFPEHYKGPFCAKLLKKKNWSKTPFMGTFWKTLNKKLRFAARSPLQN